MLRLAVTLALVAGPAMAADRFDLTCDLKETSSLKPGVVSPITRRLSVDLVSRRWCLRDEGCREMFAIAQVSATAFHLADASDAMGSRTTVIDRRTWRWTGRASLKRPAHVDGSSEGVCRVAAFTPFPRDRA